MNSNVVFEAIDNNSANFVVEPLPKGFGLTIGNALRRVLLSYVEGCAVYKVMFSVISHEFGSIKGVYEDVPVIIANIKNIGFTLTTGCDEQSVTLEVNKPGVYTSGDIDCGNVKINKKDVYILNAVDVPEPFKIEIWIKRGIGHSVDTETVAPHIAVSQPYSPVLRVSCQIEDARIGQITDHDKLRMYIETNGTIAPKEAVIKATDMIVKQFASLFSDFIPCHSVFNEDLSMPAMKRDTGPRYDSMLSNNESNEESAAIDSRFLVSIEELDLSIRSENCIKAENIQFVGDLVQKTEPEMLRIPNFGHKSLREIKEVLNGLGLSFGMSIENWPPKDLEKALEYEA